MLIWKHKDWPNFIYDSARFSSAIEHFYQDAERTYGRIEGMAHARQEDTLVDLMASSAIGNRLCISTGLGTGSLAKKVIAHQASLDALYFG